VSANPSIRTIDWDKRIRRASTLAERHPSATEVLAFYQNILGFQRMLHDDVGPRLPRRNSALAFRDQLHPSVAMPHLPALLALVQKNGPSRLAKQASDLRRAAAEEQRQMLAEFLAASPDSQPGPGMFFARVLFQPCAEALAATQAPPSGFAGSVCPVCGGRPQVAVLRPEGEGGKRFLVCSFCNTEWEFRRILCAVCEETDHERLPRYCAEDISSVRVECCDTCKYYLKSVDMTTDGLAVPLVDEVATASLDIWAGEHGYKKIQLNLMGF
jgi:FdhE protein